MKALRVRTFLFFVLSLPVFTGASASPNPMSPHQLTHPAFARAAAFIHESRPLERALFAFYFESTPVDSALAELALFQNPDGGFFGLEADIGFDASTVLSTCHALHLLHDLGAATDHPCVQRALAYLVANYDPAIEAWPIIPPHDNSQPHAPWWHYTEKTAENWHRYQDNPRPDVLACLYLFPSPKTTVLRAHVTTLTLARLRNPGTLELDGLRCYLRLFEAPGLPAELRQALQAVIPGWIEKTVERDPTKWTGYRLRPLDIAVTADSPWRAQLAADVETNLDYLIATQLPVGCWDPHWNWGDSFPEAWPAAKRRWQAVLTLTNLRTLQSYGRIAR